MDLRDCMLDKGYQTNEYPYPYPFLTSSSVSIRRIPRCEQLLCQSPTGHVKSLLGSLFVCLSIIRIASPAHLALAYTEDFHKYFYAATRIIRTFTLPFTLLLLWLYKDHIIVTQLLLVHAQTASKRMSEETNPTPKNAPRIALRVSINLPRWNLVDGRMCSC